ncbi:FxLD family lanthipeptide [Streptomyces chrestomyceticus]|uniref:FxLD family lanthipeptide n=1 Tax=Streptomyces chrestomyceticus TaxID=68185 RepID=UPI00367E9C9F
MPGLLVRDSDTITEEIDEFALDVRVIVTASPTANTGDCPTDDGCGDTCVDGASACDSFIGDPS